MKLFAAIILMSAAVAAVHGQSKLRFRFGVDKLEQYTIASGRGFEPGSRPACRAGATAKSSSCTSDSPFYFSAAVPEGNYRVTVRFGDPKATTSNVVKAELRRLMLERVDTRPGEFVERSFVVNVRTPHISTGSEVKLKEREKTVERWAWDEKLTLEFNGAKPAVNMLTIEKVEVPTIFLLGDSTVCDQPGEPYASWGQMLTRFFGDRVAVANHAESGESLKSSYGAGRLEKVVSLMKPGDHLFIQYGHNDMKEKGDGVGAFTTYASSLRQFIAAARAKGGKVVLVTPMHRRTFDAAGQITNSHGDYPEAVRRIAREEKLPLVDLHASSKMLYEAFGKDGSGALFKEGDGTHHSNFGSYELARTIVKAIRDLRLPLADYLRKDFPAFDPRRPDDFANFAVPASPAVTDLRPLGS